MKCPDLSSYRKNVYSTDPDETGMYGVYRGGKEPKQIATYYPRAAQTDWQARKLLQNVNAVSKKK